MLLAKHDIFVIRESMHCRPSKAEAFAIFRPPFAGHAFYVTVMQRQRYLSLLSRDIVEFAY